MAGVKGKSGIGGTKERGPKRTPEAITLDRAETIKLLRRGWTKTAIAAKLGVHQTQISYDWKCILKEVSAARDKDLEELIALKLEEYGEIKREAWEAWEQSKRERNRKILESSIDSVSGGERTKESYTTDDGQWSSEYLRTIINCLNAERELQGLNPAKQIEANLKGTQTINWDRLASAIPPAGVPLPDSVEDKIMGLLQEANAVPGNGEGGGKKAPKMISYVDVTKSGEKSNDSTTNGSK